MILALTQSIAEMNTRTISWGIRVRRPDNFTTFYVPVFLKSGNVLDNLGLVQACKRIVLL
jgi:hypothetical protein